MDSDRVPNTVPDHSQSQRSKVTAVSADPMKTQNAMDEYKKKMKKKAEQENSNLWQHPFVDVFKHFKLLPGSDWKANRKQGDVTEYFAKEIGRRAIQIEGTISANNFAQLPNPSGPTKNLGLTGRYVYFEVKCPRHGLPFSYHLDLGMAERSHGIRISVSNLFKNFNTSNGFVAQVPLELKNNCWTVVVLDIYELLKRSQILPSTYLIDGSYQIRSINICANTHVRGVFTSDNLYDFVTLPADMRFKFAFDLSKWPEYFNWQTLPHDWSNRKGQQGEFPGDENMNLQNLIEKSQSGQKMSRENQRKQMRQEIDGLLNESMKLMSDEEPEQDQDELKKKKYEDMQQQLNMQFTQGPADHPVSGYIIKDEDGGPQRTGASSQGQRQSDYRSGQFSGYELSRSHKLNKDPIMELKHIIGFQADKCLDLKWSKQEGENAVVFSSGGTLIAMDTENNQQKRFFFGHSAPICCFDISQSGNLIASAQEGKNSIIRLWDYATARCITMVTMPVVSLKCLSFSYDGRYLASVGKDTHNKELITVWDISRIQRGDKPEIVARQTSEFNVLSLKFSPIDVTKLCSCGKENIRFWRVRDTGNIRGSAVVLNHHARNTVFTSLDYEYGFKSTDHLENESLKRVFVGSKHGMIFQVNYQTESLEATYKTNDAAIYSISVNDAFCVTGSEDSYLRVWPLDFQEFFMEAQHEGTVSAVDISPDGLKVACGTLYGSIGILDKSNQNYKTLLRSHTDDILALDFHKQKMNIITVSKDRTIRLWDVESFDEVYEFSSPVEQPLCVSAHPHQPIFACGFETGRMRIFDIDTTEVQDEFSQFNKPLKQLSYDNTGKLLVACCADGSVSIHNAQRQHLPIKMMHLELQPEYVHVAFTERVLGEDDFQQKFGVMGEYGNNIVIYDSESFLIQHQIQVNSIVKSFKFANNNRDLLVITKDCKVRFYSLIKYEGIFMREVANCHRGNITGIDVSANSGYMLTGGEDSMVKIWDYEAQKTIPYFFQSFIGHTYPITAIIFNPRNNGQIISVGERDGIYIWDFNGDVENDYKQAHLAGQDLHSLSTLEEKPSSMLEKIRTAHKAKKAFRNQLSEDTFIIPTFKPLGQVAIENNTRDYTESPNIVKQNRLDRRLTYNHYANCSKKIEMDTDMEQSMNFSAYGNPKGMLLEQRLINGYDGFGGVHDNLYWNITGGYNYFTLNNKVIIENTKTREQHVFSDSSVQLSCMAVSDDGKYLAVGEGSENPKGISYAFLYNLEQKKKVNELPFHQKGIQSMAFSKDSQYLIAVGVQGDSSLAVYEISSGRVLDQAVLGHHATNKIKIDPNVDGTHVGFITIGNNASLTIWRFDTQREKLIFQYIEEPEMLRNTHFLCADFTSYLPSPVSTYYIVIGDSDGALVAYDQNKQTYVELGTSRGQIIDGAIGCISIKTDSIVIVSQQGLIARYPIKGSSIQPDDPNDIINLNVESAIISLSMDESNVEGLIGTEAGCIHYVHFAENVIIPLVSSNNKNQDSVDFIKCDPTNSQIFFTNCGSKSDEVKIFTNQNCDLVNTFQSSLDEDGHVVFVISDGKPAKKQWRIVGFSNGVLKRISLDTLSIDQQFKVPLNSQEKLTCGHFSENKTNIVIGTNQGTLIFATIQAHRKRCEIQFCRIEDVGRTNNFDTDFKSKTDLIMNRDLNDNESIDIEHNRSAEDLHDFTGITSIHFPYVDPIGTILVSFDDGTVKVWQCSGPNDQLKKILELQQAATRKFQNQPVYYDVAKVGYQQYDLTDSFDIFANPEGLEEVTENDRQYLNKLYKDTGKKYKSCTARFPPGSSASAQDQYFCFVDALQYIFVRNFKRNEISKRISLTHFPTCINIYDFSKIKIEETAAIGDKQAKGTFMVSVGTKQGKIIIYRIGPTQQQKVDKLLVTKPGLAFGGISSLDISGGGQDLIAVSDSGEIIQFDLLKKLNEE